ncbi:hypothetical protein [Eubacterium sp.]
MSRFTTFINKIRSSSKARFVCRVLLFYVVIMIIWGYYMCSRDAAAPVFIYEEF